MLMECRVIYYSSLLRYSNWTIIHMAAHSCPARRMDAVGRRVNVGRYSAEQSIPKSPDRRVPASTRRQLSERGSRRMPSLYRPAGCYTRLNPDVEPTDCDLWSNLSLTAVEYPHALFDSVVADESGMTSLVQPRTLAQGSSEQQQQFCWLQRRAHVSGLGGYLEKASEKGTKTEGVRCRRDGNDSRWTVASLRGIALTASS
ncbi:hypothetical protein QBC47DRAFT_177204 [Echria macrotheca]|uniref:Uncharacterized protein n=1 Tax=Echria macrotheca TaxID=438768 RepID=A0AAJ0BHE5_9PEZI|nr:hypothetical protein QBC47DRAFT_177204 [Echria macrotheca]